MWGQRRRATSCGNVLAVVPKGSNETVGAAIRTIFAEPDAEARARAVRRRRNHPRRQLPKVESMLRDAREDLLPLTGSPVSHWKKIWSTNPLERLSKEVKRLLTKKPDQQVGQARTHDGMIEI